MTLFIFLSILGIICFFYVVAHFLVFFKMGIFVFLSPISATSVIVDPYFLSEITTIFALVLLLLVFWLYIRSEYSKYIHLREHRIYSVSLQELSHIWGSGNIVVSAKEAVPVLYLKNFEQERTKNFVSRYIEKNIRFFPKEKLEIIFELLKILETNAIHSPSVASKYKNDPEKTGNYQSVVTPDGKTTYDIFLEINLYEHTMNVAEKSVEFLKDKDPISFETIMCDGIIVALAHDIGKLYKIKQYNKEYPDDILIQNPHQAISKMFFTEMWPGYSTIEEAIYNHHAAPNATSLLTRMIVTADKEARKMEQLNWQSKRSEEKKTSSWSDENKTENIPDAYVLKEEGEILSTDKPKKSRTKARDIEKDMRKKEENSEIPINFPEETEGQVEEEKHMVIASPVDIASIEKQYERAEEIEYSDELEAKIFADLSLEINQYTLEKPQGIHSISYDACILFSVTHFNAIVKKHIYTNGEDPSEIKRIGMYISSKFFEKGYTMYMSKDAGCSTFFLDINKKQFKFFCIPIKSEVFNMGTYEVEQLKKDWLKKIIVSDYRKGSSI